MLTAPYGGHLVKHSRMKLHTCQHAKPKFIRMTVTLVSCCDLHHAFHSQMPLSSTFWFDGVSQIVWSNFLHHRQFTLSCQTLVLKCGGNASARLKEGAHDGCCCPSEMLTFQSISQGRLQSS